MSIVHMYIHVYECKSLFVAIIIKEVSKLRGWMFARVGRHGKLVKNVTTGFMTEIVKKE